MKPVNLTNNNNLSNIYTTYETGENDSLNFNILIEREFVIDH